MAEMRLWRSLLFVPANNWKMLSKAATEEADGVIIDLEDACPVPDLETGRVFAKDIAPTLKNAGIDVLVRINALPTGLTEQDLSVVISEDIDGVMLPKADTAQDIVRLEQLLEKQEKEKGIAKRIEILPLIESPTGVIHVHEIARASDRIAGIAFGAGDFMRELGEGFTITTLTPDEYFPVLLYARSQIAMAACAAGIPAIDTPFFGLLIDTDGLEREARKAKLLGFKGKMVTHPRHIDIVNRVFSPSEEDITLSHKMVDAYNTAAAEGKGAAVLDGRMIDIAMYKMAQDLLSKVESIRKKSALRKGKSSQTMWVPGL